MARRSLLVLLLLVPVLAACALPGSDAAQVADCEEGFVEGLLSLPPVDNSEVDEDALKDRIHGVCAELVEAGFDDNSSMDEILAYFGENPELAGEMCEISTEALYGAGLDLVVDSYQGYVTHEDVTRLGRDGCTYAVVEGYGSFTTPLNLGGLLREHPDLATPFCRAPLMQDYDRRQPARSRRVYAEVVTEACMQAIRSGVVDYSSGDYLNPTIDQRGFRQLLRQEWAKKA